MTRLILSALVAVLALSSCDKLFKNRAAGNNGSLSEQIRITSPSKPEIVAAFEAISMAVNEHNRVLIENIDTEKPANELAYSAGIAHLDRSARGQGELARRIIGSVASTCAYEKDLFTPFDTIKRQVKGMPTWTSNEALQRRGYIQIIDQQLITFDAAVAYLERGEEPLLQRNFDRQGVPREISGEFLRLRRLSGKDIAEAQRGMFQEERSALQSYREAMTSADPAKANQHVAQANQHVQKSKQFKDRMIAEMRKQLNAPGLL